MPRKKLTHSRADVKAQWKLLEDLGQEPVSVKYHPDGTFRIMTSKHALITNGSKAEITPNEWDVVLTNEA